MNYEDFTIVKLKAALEQEEWFKLANGTCVLDVPKSGFINNNRKPAKAEIDVEYLDVKCKFIAQMKNNFVGGQILVRLTYPNYCWRKTQRATGVEKVVCKIQDGFLEATDKIEEYTIQHAKEIRREKIEQGHIMDIAKATGVPCKQEAKWDSTILTFRMSKNFAIEFYPLSGKTHLGKLKPEEHKYNVRSVSGHFSLEQLKKLINFSTECPEAIADRLISGK